MQQDNTNAQQAADDMSSLIPEYRSTLARMKKQVDELQLRLEDACQERHSLHQQVRPVLTVAFWLSQRSVRYGVKAAPFLSPLYIRARFFCCTV